jgi:hypothetical protein
VEASKQLDASFYMYVNYSVTHPTDFHQYWDSGAETAPQRMGFIHITFA